jgi:hypothetical protein
LYWHFNVLFNIKSVSVISFLGIVHSNTPSVSFSLWPLLLLSYILLNCLLCCVGGASFECRHS